jgi:hypothetical protein
LPFSFFLPSFFFLILSSLFIYWFVYHLFSPLFLSHFHSHQCLLLRSLQVSNEGISVREVSHWES